MSVHRALTTRHHAADSLNGRLLTAEHPGYDRARRAWNLAVDQRPAAIVAAASAQDVAGAVAIAQDQGLRLAPQGTGHGAAALGSLADTILLRTDHLRSAQVNPHTQIVRLGAGVTWDAAVKAAADHGLALLAGSSPDVGVVGYTLGGGLSWLSRKHGLACNHVEVIELVTADGRLIRTDREREPDLFWALRGGGGSFGVVTAIELRALTISEIHGGAMWWPIERGEDVLHLWRDLTTGGLPDELTTIARLLRLPDLPEIPEPLRGGSFVVVEAFHEGDPADADELLAPLRALAPEQDTVATVPVGMLSRLSLDPDHPVPAEGDGMLLSQLPPAAIDALLAGAGAGVDSPLLSVEIRHLGGELSRTGPGHGVLASVEAPYALFAVGIAPTPDARRVVRADLERLRADLAPWDAPRMYLNFAETRRDPAALWSEHRYRRLCQIKGRFDPDDLIRANHPIPPA